MNYRAGQIVSGKITGIQPYGAFLSLDEEVTGLIHISEISDGYVKDVSHFVSLGQTVEVKIIDFDAKTNQARCSLKACHTRHVRKDRKVNRLRLLPNNKIGFKSIAEHMGQWVKEAKEANYDKF